jgi:hypothetical protein
MTARLLRLRQALKLNVQAINRLALARQIALLQKWMSKMFRAYESILALYKVKILFRFLLNSFRDFLTQEKDRLFRQ